MKRFLCVAALALAAAIPLFLQTRATAQTPVTKQPDPRRALVDTYCIGCHSTRVKTGGLSLEGLNLQAAAKDAQIWEKVLRKLRGHQMPPPGSPQPKLAQVDAFITSMSATLDAPTKGPKAGYVPIQRLNRTEYVATVKALVGVDVNAKDVLPQDIQVEGFDNVADALSVSPSFLDQYVAAARHVARLAVGSANPRVSSVTYPVAANQSPDNPPPPRHARRHPLQTQFPHRRRIPLHHHRPRRRPLPERPRKAEHRRHHGRWQDRLPQAHRRPR